MLNITKYINHIYRASRGHRSKYFEKYEISGHQLSYLIAICKFPGLNQDAISDWMYVNKSTVTRNINQLLNLGLVKREIDDQDKRSRKLYPTEKLNNMREDINKYLDFYNAELLSKLDDDEKVLFVEMLKKVSESAFESIKEDDDV